MEMTSCITRWITQPVGLQRWRDGKQPNQPALPLLICKDPACQQHWPAISNIECPPTARQIYSYVPTGSNTPNHHPITIVLEKKREVNSMETQIHAVLTFKPKINTVR